MPPPSAALARPLKLAVVGAGPSAFYAASRVLSKLPASTPQGEQTRVHMYDKSWAPHGLVRYGVAPDHPEVKVSNPRNPRDRPPLLTLPNTDLRIASTNSTKQPKTLGSATSETSLYRPLHPLKPHQILPPCRFNFPTCSRITPI